MGIPTTETYPMPTADSLPANVAGWTADADRALVLVHDMQRYFLRPLPPEPHDALVRNCARLHDAAAQAGIPVCYTAQPGDMNARQRGLLQEFWGPGMRTAPADREIVDELVPTGDDRVFTKWRYSAFVHTELLDTMRTLGRDQIVLCGVYAHVGLLATAIEAFSHDIETFLVADAVADFTEERHLGTLRYASERCASVQVTDELLAWLDASRSVAPAVLR